jgi:hypothetical protein
VRIVVIFSPSLFKRGDRGELIGKVKETECVTYVSGHLIPSLWSKYSIN